jgi:hypothetical protein
MRVATAYTMLTLSLAGCLVGLPVLAQPLPQELRANFPAASLSGQARLTFWSLQVYEASLWIAPGFAEDDYERSRLALELTYLRNFKGAEIAERSMAEMRRQGAMTQAQETAWENQMRALFPDVGPGDRITGVHQPDTGATFWRNGRWLGDVRDPVFSKRFFGIWLSANTSEPQLRRALLARARSSAPAGAAP